MFNILIGLFALICGAFSSFFAHASDFRSPRAEGLGGAGHAAPMLSDAIYLNPSYTSFVQSHSLSFNYQTFEGGTLLNASVLDGTPDSLFQAGVGYTRRNDNNFIHVGASKAVVQKIGIGIGAKFIFPNDNSGEKITDGTLSVSGNFSKAIQASLIVDNVFQAAPSRGLYREIVLGTRVNFDSIFQLYIDPHWVPDLPAGQPAWGYEAGAEFPFFTDFFLRMGIFRAATIPTQGQRGDGYAFGVGWNAPRLALDYSITRVTEPFTSLSHNFGASVYF